MINIHIERDEEELLSFSRYKGQILTKYKTDEEMGEVPFKCVVNEIIKRVYKSKTEYVWTFRWPEPSRSTGAYTLYTAKIIVCDSGIHGFYETDYNVKGPTDIACMGINENDRLLTIDGEWFENSYVYEFKLEGKKLIEQVDKSNIVVKTNEIIETVNDLIQSVDVLKLPLPPMKELVEHIQQTLPSIELNRDHCDGMQYMYDAITWALRK
jgi:hypothetical protein